MDARVMGATLGEPFAVLAGRSDPAPRMLLIGAQGLAQHLCALAQFNGFSVTVCDPRIEFMATWSVPGVERLTLFADDAVVAFGPDSQSCVVTLAQDPALTDLALLEALRSEAFYVGSIGSWLEDQSRRHRLIAQFGETETSLKALRGPIGIAIGSRTPAEMAVSVMADILAAKNGITLPASVRAGMPVDMDHLHSPRDACPASSGR